MSADLRMVMAGPPTDDVQPRPAERTVAESPVPPILSHISSPSDTKSLIETAVRRFVAEVPALESLKLVVGLELRGRGDVQLYRVELPGPKVTKDIAPDAKVRLELPRSHFNALVAKGHIQDWRQAFEKGDVKATGIEQVMKLIVNVVERQEERSRTRRVRT